MIRQVRKLVKKLSHNEDGDDVRARMADKSNIAVDMDVDVADDAQSICANQVKEDVVNAVNVINRLDSRKATPLLSRRHRKLIKTTSTATSEVETPEVKVMRAEHEEKLQECVGNVGNIEKAEVENVEEEKTAHEAILHAKSVDRKEVEDKNEDGSDSSDDEDDLETKIRKLSEYLSRSTEMLNSQFEIDENKATSDEVDGLNEENNEENQENEEIDNSEEDQNIKEILPYLETNMDDFVDNPTSTDENINIGKFKSKLKLISFMV